MQVLICLYSHISFLQTTLIVAQQQSIGQILGLMGEFMSWGTNLMLLSLYLCRPMGIKVRDQSGQQNLGLFWTLRKSRRFSRHSFVHILVLIAPVAMKYLFCLHTEKNICQTKFHPSNFFLQQNLKLLEGQFLEFYYIADNK